MMQPGLGGGQMGLQQMMQNPQAMNQLRQMLMMRMGQGGIPGQGMPSAGMQAQNPVATQAMNQGAAPQARTMAMAGNPAMTPNQAQGGYTPNAAAQQNPQLGQQMQQNRFLQMLQQRLNQR